jgi:hypothetical protein
MKQSLGFKIPTSWALPSSRVEPPRPRPQALAKRRYPRKIELPKKILLPSRLNFQDNRAARKIAFSEITLSFTREVNSVRFSIDVRKSSTGEDCGSQIREISSVVLGVVIQLYVYVHHFI